MPMWGDDLTVLAGAEYRQQDFHTFARTTPESPLVTQGSQRTVKTLFAEAILPFWGKHNQRRGLESLALSLGARYEDYSDFGRAFTPRVGLKWSPMRGLAFRGSWSRSFRAPSLVDLDESQNAAGFTFLPDPSAPGGIRGALLWSGRNASLHEETAHSWTAGFDLTPARVPGLSLAATYFDIDFTDRLDSPIPSADLLTNPRFADMISRNPSAAQIEAVCQRAPNALTRCSSSLPISAIVDLRMRNDASLRTRGVDIIGKYVWEVPYGALTLGLNGTYLFVFKEAKSARLPLQDLVSTQTNPIDLRLRASLGWRLGGFELSSFANFSNHYRDTASVPERTVSKLLTLDLNVSYEFAHDRGPLLSNTTWALAVQNLQNRDPPYLRNGVVGIGYDQENADPLGRFIGLTIRRNW
jgi:iron complex outermembrane receptor protein